MKKSSGVQPKILYIEEKISLDFSFLSQSVSLLD